MLMMTIRRFCAGVMMALLLTNCLGSGKPNKKSIEQSEIVLPAGTRHPVLGVAFDLSYDPRTDGIIPGYRILNVGITNDSLNVLKLDPMVDRWQVVDRRGTKRTAVVNLRRTDPDVWTALPARLKQLIEYPLMVNTGETRAVDLMFSEKYILSDFKEVIFEGPSLGKRLRIYARESTQ